MKKTFLTMIVAAAALHAQPLGFGIKGGVPLTDLFSTQNNLAGTVLNTETERYIIGPMVELRLPAGFSIEADALYSRANFSSALTAAGSFSTSVVDTNSWEFPVVLKKKFGGAHAVAVSARPYVEAGASFRHLSGLGSLPS